MVKSVLGVNHQGLRDWLFQRISAVFMAIYVIGLLVYFIWQGEVSYYDWHNLFSQLWIKIATLLFFASILVHAWVGMWTIFTDYVTCPVARLVLNIIVFFALLGFFFAALLILWGV
ncbi:MAG TPA: succinate dehydrogenase, hydrophobic membrane anchor protein [Gammaproteobacteria bacterium]|nr:succinate dehydrogenase, hydrophobic membrane anchor protein [Gammaproteobacteria bacterium]